MNGDDQIARDPNVQAYRLDKLEEEVKRGFLELNEKMDAMLRRPQCPSPGLCMGLKETLATLREDGDDREKRLHEIENLVEQGKGIGVAGRGLWAFIGAGGLGLIATAVYIFQHAAK
jgi:hypothetical protein